MQYFTTERLQVAIFIHATNQLRFVGYKMTRPGVLAFVFEDQEHLGNGIELEFDRGAAVPATALFASQKFLRRTMTEALENRNNGIIYDPHKS